MLTEMTVVSAGKDQLSTDLGDDVVILGLQSGIYFGLNAVGAHVWRLIQQPCTVREVRDSVLDEFEVEPHECTRDVLELLQSMHSAGLIEVK
jgi:hypothetical protein